MIANDRIWEGYNIAMPDPWPTTCAIALKKNRVFPKKFHFFIRVKYF